ncbi:MAG: dihydropteroate synthase [Gemmatimonadetes bacterium]|nr:dihydropteroate synthase [Gemmatimonadota bacterium]
MAGRAAFDREPAALRRGGGAAEDEGPAASGRRAGNDGRADAATDTEAGRRAAVWRTARAILSLESPRIIGILNVTPDSFWDGGRYTGVDAAVAHAERLLAEGVDLVDVGGESTRPGAQPVSAEEERRRVLPVLRELVRRFPDLLVSIDTVKADVAGAALAEGAAVINDVSGLRLDAGIAETVARAGAGVVLMHSRGAVERMASYELAVYGPDPVAEISRELGASLERARAAGIPDDAIVLDPGLGFSKRTEHSVAVIAGLHRLLALGRPVLLGPSRKRFVGELAAAQARARDEAPAAPLPPEARLEGTIAACVAGLFRGARLFRVHDVDPVRRALAVADAILAAS